MTFEAASRSRSRAGGGSRRPLSRSHPGPRLPASVSCAHELRPRCAPCPGRVPVRRGRRRRVRVADGEHVDPPAGVGRGRAPAAARPRPAPLRRISGPRGRGPRAEVPLVLSERHVPARGPGAGGGRARARGGAARTRLLALELGVAVQGERHRHVGAVQLVPAPRQAAEAADAGPRHAAPPAARPRSRLPAPGARAARPRRRPRPAALPAPPQRRPLAWGGHTGAGSTWGQPRGWGWDPGVHSWCGGRPEGRRDGDAGGGVGNRPEALTSVQVLNVSEYNPKFPKCFLTNRAWLWGSPAARLGAGVGLGAGAAGAFVPGGTARTRRHAGEVQRGRGHRAIWGLRFPEAAV